MPLLPITAQCLARLGRALRIALASPRLEHVDPQRLEFDGALPGDFVAASRGEPVNPMFGLGSARRVATVLPTYAARASLPVSGLEAAGDGGHARPARSTPMRGV